jgi:hypothetical protein
MQPPCQPSSAAIARAPPRPASSGGQQSGSAPSCRAALRLLGLSIPAMAGRLLDEGIAPRRNAGVENVKGGPMSETGQGVQGDLPTTIGRPATRALHGAGYTHLAQLPSAPSSSAPSRAASREATRPEKGRTMP